jgi:hypothetical protein
LQKNSPINTTDENKDEMNKRRPKPFRYITDINVLEKNNSSDEDEMTISVMNKERNVVSVDTNSKTMLSNFENKGKIEEIIKKHETIRKLVEE